jgi:Cof subfamily protein (haloacid dehalogenase superfamily)
MKMDILSQKKLLFTDLDGTLLRHDGTVSATVKAALQQMMQKGHRLILTSGRSLASILPIAQQILSPQELTDDCYPNTSDQVAQNLIVVADNGSCIYDFGTKKVILDLRFTPKQVRFYTEEAQKAGLHIQLYVDGCLYSTKESEELIYYRKGQSLPYRIVEDLAAVAPNGCGKMVLIHLTDRLPLEQYRERVKNIVNEQVELLFSGPKYMDILPEGSGKGNAVLFLQKHLGVLPTCVYAIGDEENDISMLKSAHTGIAVQNAKDAVKAAADMVTQRDNEHDGILEVLERFF